MTVSVSATESDNMADTLNTNIGNSHLLVLYNAADAELATMTFAASLGTVGVTSGAASITYAESSYTDEASANAGTCSYATIETAGGAAEVIRFTDPTTELSLSSTTIGAGDAVQVTADVVVKLPDST